VLGGGDDPEILENAVQWIQSRAGAPLGVSLPALGEALVDLACREETRPGKGRPSPYERLLNLVRDGKVEVCWLDHLQPGGALLSLADEMRGVMAGSNFGATDALILACAVQCRTSERVYTTDKRMSDPKLRPLLRKQSGGYLRPYDRFED
jgi:hypothetical protein